MTIAVVRVQVPPRVQKNPAFLVWGFLRFKPIDFPVPHEAEEYIMYRG